MNAKIGSFKPYKANRLALTAIQGGSKDVKCQKLQNGVWFFLKIPFFSQKQTSQGVKFRFVQTYTEIQGKPKLT